MCDPSYLGEEILLITYLGWRLALLLFSFVGSQSFFFSFQQRFSSDSHFSFHLSLSHHINNTSYLINSTIQAARNMESVIKAAKKILKKDDKGSMKIKQLAKAVVEKIGKKDGGEEPSTNEVKDWIMGSDKFAMEGKLVSLGCSSSSKKRKEISSSSSSPSPTEGGDSGKDDIEKAKKKAAKRARKEAKKNKKKKEEDSTSGSSPSQTVTISTDDALKWRAEHKVVLKVTQDGDEGTAASKELSNNAVYLPYSSFDSPKCKENINPVLLKQCTEVNGFTKPSAIQAQCWPVLLHSNNGKKRDVVG